jgi:hypothetical protein
MPHHPKNALKRQTIHTYYSRIIPEGVAEASQILFQDVRDLPKLFSNEEYCRREWWQALRRLIAICLRCKCYKPPVTFCDTHGRKGEVLSFYFVPDTTRGRPCYQLLGYALQISNEYGSVTRNKFLMKSVPTLK